MKKFQLISFFSGLALTFHFPGLAAAQNVSTANRDILVVSNLETHGRKDYAWLYRFLETMSVSLAEKTLKDSYRNLYVLAGENSSTEKFATSLQSLTQDPDLTALDVFIHLHGSPDRLWFEDRDARTEELGHQLKSTLSQASKLRALYSTACYGKSHAPDFLNAGFWVVNGAEKVNTNSPHDYPAFMNAWKSNQMFEAAQADGNNPGWIAFYDSIAQAAGFDDVGSYKVVVGNGQTTIQSERPL
ncbi:MAG TPA: hypothetical protein VE954_29095 [Oligoflexus sp.]|uniref:hypothetical protein n=1 Tax=Oligoflexus sp. TaxID=1971216 RepID=UPI002D5DB2C0|nr:hypothetical protein [Oligoflexus sp.]HYX37179.1 hypothetical protein [Oligoflexus sp.]